MASYDSPTGAPGGGAYNQLRNGGGRGGGLNVSAGFTVDTGSLNKLHTTWQQLIGDVRTFNKELKALDQGIRVVERLATATQKLRNAQPGAGSLGNYGIPNSGINRGGGPNYPPRPNLPSPAGSNGGPGGGTPGAPGVPAAPPSGGSSNGRKIAEAFGGAVIGLGANLSRNMPDILAAQQQALFQARASNSYANPNNIVNNQMFGPGTGGYANSADRTQQVASLRQAYGPTLLSGRGRQADLNAQMVGALTQSTSEGTSSAVGLGSTGTTMGLMGIGVRTYSQGNLRPTDSVARDVLTRIYRGRMPSVDEINAGMAQGGKLAASLQNLGIDPGTQDFIVQYGLAQARATAAGAGNISMARDRNGKIVSTAANNAAQISGAHSLTDSALAASRTGAQADQALGTAASGSATAYYDMMSSVHDIATDSLKVKIVGGAIGGLATAGMGIGNALGLGGGIGQGVGSGLQQLLEFKMLQSVLGGKGTPVPKGTPGGVGGITRLLGGGASGGLLSKLGARALPAAALAALGGVAGDAIGNIGRNHTTGKQNAAAGILGGAVSGAGVGAGIGTMIAPGVGTAIGGVIGAGAGMIGPAFNAAGGWSHLFGGSSPVSSALTSAPGMSNAAKQRGGAAKDTSKVVWPAAGPITQGFGSHPGIDIGAPCNAPILAAEDGVVIDAGPATGFGNWIVITHPDGYSTVYGHMYNDGLLVHSGARVKAGQQIGKVGSNGESTGCHLHFEVHIGWPGQRIDPAAWLRGHNAAAAPGGGGGAAASPGAAGAASGSAPSSSGSSGSAGSAGNYGSVEEITALAGLLSGYSGGASAAKSSSAKAAGAASPAAASKAASGAVSASKVANAGSGVQRWASLASKVLGYEHQNAAMLGPLLAQMQLESGGDPNITQQIKDINSASGNPAEGLMQVTKTTFQGSHWPGTSWNIFDPEANIAAGLNYAVHRYPGDPQHGMGHGHGYRLGTMYARDGGSVHEGEIVLNQGTSSQVRSYLNSHRTTNGTGGPGTTAMSRSTNVNSPLVHVNLTMPMQMQQGVTQADADRLVRMVKSALESDSAIANMALGKVSN